MKKFEIRILSTTGEIESIGVEAENNLEARNIIYSMGKFPIQVTEVTPNQDYDSLFDEEEEISSVDETENCEDEDEFPVNEDGERPTSENRAKIMALIMLLENKIQSGKASDMEKLGLEAIRLLLKYEKPIDESIKSLSKAAVEWFVEKQKNKPINRVATDVAEIKENILLQNKAIISLLELIVKKGR